MVHICFEQCFNAEIVAHAPIEEMGMNFFRELPKSLRVTLRKPPGYAADAMTASAIGNVLRSERNLSNVVLVNLNALPSTQLVALISSRGFSGRSANVAPPNNRSLKTSA